MKGTIIGHNAQGPCSFQRIGVVQYIHSREGVWYSTFIPEKGCGTVHSFQRRGVVQYIHSREGVWYSTVISENGCGTVQSFQRMGVVLYIHSREWVWYCTYQSLWTITFIESHMYTYVSACKDSTSHPDVCVGAACTYGLDSLLVWYNVVDQHLLTAPHCYMIL